MFYISNSPVETHIIAASITKKLLKKYKKIFFLISGNLGSGKTEFVKGVASELGIDKKKIKSPTFITISEFEKFNKLVHIDLYRIDNKFVEKIIRDLLEELYIYETQHKDFKNAVVFCFEWAKKISKKIIPMLRSFDNSTVVYVDIIHLSETKRKIVLKKII